MFELKNKKFVVTGGGGGIGHAITRAIGGNVVVFDVLNTPMKYWETLPQQIDRDFKLEYIRWLSRCSSDRGYADSSLQSQCDPREELDSWIRKSH